MEEIIKLAKFENDLLRLKLNYPNFHKDRIKNLEKKIKLLKNSKRIRKYGIYNN